MDPPERAVVLGVDEKSQCQALERTQPSLPLTPGRAGTTTHDDKRHGTTTLFAALDAATGGVLCDFRQRHRHQELLAFLKLIDLHVPKDLDVDLVLDSYGSHKHPVVRAWLDHPKRARFHVHFTPTSSSWAEPHRTLVPGAHRRAPPPGLLHQRRPVSRASEFCPVVASGCAR